MSLSHSAQSSLTASVSGRSRSAEHHSGHSGQQQQHVAPPPELPVVTSRVTSQTDVAAAAGPSRQTSVLSVAAGISLKQKALIILMCIQSFATFVMIALISPFYPNVAMEKGASVTQVNSVFSILFLTIFLTSPVFGRYLTVIGPKFLYLSGVYVRIVSDMCFGLLNYMPDGTVFITMSFLIRIISAVGGSAFSTAAYAIVAKEFPDKVSIMFGLLQTMTACGLMMGPPIGGVLYDLGKETIIDPYTFPFLCSAVFGLCITVINTFFLPTTEHAPSRGSDTDGAGKPRGMLVLLRNPRVVLNMVAVALAYMPLVHTEISLEPHLDQFELTPTFVGLMFTCQTAAYAIFSSVWGWIDNHWFYPRLQISLGTTVYVFACLLIGPSPLFDIKPQLWLVGVSLSLIGFSASAMNTASFKDSVNQALGMGMSHDFDTSGLISGLFLGSFTVGAFIGPTVGGAIAEVYESAGYEWSMTLYGFIQAGYIVLLIISVFVSKVYRNRTRVASENVPLLRTHSKS